MKSTLKKNFNGKVVGVDGVFKVETKDERGLLEKIVYQRCHFYGNIAFDSPTPPAQFRSQVRDAQFDAMDDQSQSTTVTVHSSFPEAKRAETNGGICIQLGHKHYGPVSLLQMNYDEDIMTLKQSILNFQQAFCNRKTCLVIEDVSVAVMQFCFEKGLSVNLLQPNITPVWTNDLFSLENSQGYFKEGGRQQQNQSMTEQMCQNHVFKRWYDLRNGHRDLYSFLVTTEQTHRQEALGLACSEPLNLQTLDWQQQQQQAAAAGAGAGIFLEGVANGGDHLPPPGFAAGGGPVFSLNAAVAAADDY
jgi:hypothetical protein